jgi:hypothetical protein
MLSYSIDVSILKPINTANGNHVLLYDVVNRGNKVVTGFFNVGVTAANPDGDGFLEQQGYSIVWSGWQATSCRPEVSWECRCRWRRIRTVRL